jgi:hypothetical protein
MGVQRPCLEFQGRGGLFCPAQQDWGEWVLVAGLRASHVMQVVLAMAM